MNMYHESSIQTPGTGHLVSVPVAIERYIVTISFPQRILRYLGDREPQFVKELHTEIDKAMLKQGINGTLGISYDPFRLEPLFKIIAIGFPVRGQHVQRMEVTDQPTYSGFRQTAKQIQQRISSRYDYDYSQTED